MDKASDFGSEDCEFESRRGRFSFGGIHVYFTTTSHCCRHVICDPYKLASYHVNGEIAESSKTSRPRRDSNSQSSDPKSDALSIRPRGH